MPPTAFLLLLLLLLLSLPLPLLLLLREHLLPAVMLLLMGIIMWSAVVLTEAVAVVDDSGIDTYIDMGAGVGVGNDDDGDDNGPADGVNATVVEIGGEQESSSPRLPPLWLVLYPATVRA